MKRTRPVAQPVLGGKPTLGRKPVLGRKPLLAACAVGLASLSGFGAMASSASPSTYTIGNFNPYSGPDASFGPEMTGGCQPAVRLINAAGGVAGHSFTCLQVDTRGDPADAVSAATKLIATNSSLVGILGPSSDEALATVPIFEQAHVPMFVDTGQAYYDKTRLTYFWRITAADDVKGYALALWAHKLGYTRAAAVFGNDAGSQSDVPTLLKAYKKLGGKMVSNQILALDQSSYRTEIEQMLATHPQVIFTEVDPQTAGTYLSELQQLHGLIPIIGTEVTLQAPWLKAVTGAIGSSALAKYFTGMQPYAPTSGSSWSIYNKALLASRSSVPNPSQWSSDPYSMTYYDGVNIMALAMVAARSASPTRYDALIPAVTEAGRGKVVVHSFAEGKAALLAGKKIEYVGAGGPIAFNQWHNSSGAFEAAHVVKGNTNIVGEVTAGQIANLSR